MIRRPLVLIDGVIRQLPEDDLLPVPESGARAAFGNSLFPDLPVLLKTGPQSVSVRAGTTVPLESVTVRFESDTPVSMPALAAGEDYSVWVHPNGSVSAVADPYSSPAAPPVSGAIKIGGFHRGHVAPGATVASGAFPTSGSGMIWLQTDVDRIAGVNEWSLWDLLHRPTCDPRGMVCVAGATGRALVWVDIYFCGQTHITEGTSRSGAAVASATVPPRKPLVFGGTGSNNYSTLTWYDANEIAISHGKRLLSYQEFAAAAFGTTEGQSLGGASSTIPTAGRAPGYTSKWGVEQVTGNHWTWGLNAHGVQGGSWSSSPGRGGSYGNPYAGYFGGGRGDGAYSGSRCAAWSRPPWENLWGIGLRACCDPAPRFVVAAGGEGSGSAPSVATPTLRGKTIAIAGDSVTAQHSPGGSPHRVRAIGYMMWAQMLSGNRLIWDSRNNFGVGSDNSADLRARIDDVIAADTDYILIAIGGNDVTHPIPVEETLENLDAIWGACLSAGKQVLAVGLYPRGTQTTYNDAHKAKAAKINAHIRRAARERHGIEFIDPYPLLADYSSLDGRALEHATTDGIHPGVWGAFHLGKALAERIRALEPPRDGEFSDTTDRYHPTNNPTGNALVNGMLIGTGGTLSGGATGAVAQNWVVGRAGGIGVVASKTTSHQGYPAQRIVVSGTSSGSGSQAFAMSIPTSWPTGVPVEAGCVVRIDEGVNLGGLQLILRVTTPSGETDVVVGEVTATSNTLAMRIPDGTWEGVLRTPQYNIPANANDVRLIVGTGGLPGAVVSGALEVSRAYIREV